MTDPDPRIDAYLAERPAEQRALLENLRALVHRVVPDATETISYGMPGFRVDGRGLLSFAGWKDHCSLYPLTGSFMAAHADLVEGFDRTKGSIHFTPANPLPDAVLEGIVAARLADLRAGRR